MGRNVSLDNELCHAHTENEVLVVTNEATLLMLLHVLMPRKSTNYYIWFHAPLHFMGIKNSTKACNTKKEPTHVSMIVFGYLGFYLL